MTRIDRRRFVQLSGAGVAAAAGGGLAAIVASGRAPAFAQGTTLHWVRGSDYVPLSDQTMRTKINEQAQKDLGIKINLEGVDGLTPEMRRFIEEAKAAGVSRCPIRDIEKQMDRCPVGFATATPAEARAAVESFFRESTGGGADEA